MDCIDRLRYNWFLWFGVKNKRKPSKHPMQHVVTPTHKIIVIDGTKLHRKKSKFEIVEPK
jgi:hypothetical protein